MNVQSPQPPGQADNLGPHAPTCLHHLVASGNLAANELREAWIVDYSLRHGVDETVCAIADGTSREDVLTLLRSRGVEPLTACPDSRCRFSAVVPVYNEEDNIIPLVARIQDVLSSLGSYEIVFVNDGSSDKSTELICAARTAHPEIKLLNLSRNFGHQAAISAGLDHTSGDAVIILDADLQDPPELIEQFVDKWQQGFKVVYAVRRSRKENLLKQLSYRAFYRLMRCLSSVEMPLDSGDFCLMDRTVVNHLKQLPERNRFVRGLRTWVGFKQAAIPYDRPARTAGTPKYTFRKLLKLALDGLLSFSGIPLRLAIYAGFLTTLAGIGYLAYALGMRLFGGSVPKGWTSLVAIILLLGGAQLLLLGVLGEYVYRIYDESKQRPHYIVSEFLG